MCFGRQGLVGEVVLAMQIQVAVGEYGEGRERGQGSGLLLQGQPGQVLGVPLATIVDVRLKYGKYLSLKNYLAKLQRLPTRNAA